MFCSRCGRQVTTQVARCPKCGLVFRAALPAEDDVTPVTPLPTFDLPTFDTPLADPTPDTSSFESGGSDFGDGSAGGGGAGGDY